MKKHYNLIKVAVAAVMTLSSVALASCSKEADENIINPQNQVTAAISDNDTKSLQFFVDEWFHDSAGHCWHIKGYGQWITTNGVRNGVVLDIKYMQAGQRVYTFDGTAVWDLNQRPPQVTITSNTSPFMTQMAWTLIRDYSKYLLFD